ncbi:MAG TPA: hypothetical protein VGI67_21985 [Thermoleophilaceae bacterium]|jgi:uncharacterized cupredoxin-like copper-binding protein
MWRGQRRLRIAACALAGAAALVASALLMSGCGVTGSAGAQSRVPLAKVWERDFRIKAPTELPAGNVRLSVYNDGPDAHELIVVREGSKPLPFRGDGLTIDEDAVERSTAGALEPGQPETTRQLNLHLTPGRYVLFCNMSGHYLGGMHTQLVVR